MPGACHVYYLMHVDFCRHMNCSLPVAISLLSLSSALEVVACVCFHEQCPFVTQFSMLVHALIAMRPAACLECLADTRCILVQAG